MRIVARPPVVRRRRPMAAALLCAVALAAMAPAAGAGTNSARYRFEGNRWLSLDLAVEDVRADTIKFEWPSTVLGIKSGYKATVKVANGSTRQASIGIAIAIYDADARLVGAGTTGTKLGTLSPGDTAEFSVDFGSVTAKLTTAAQFHIALETR
jgi:hypothetical protein